MKPIISRKLRKEVDSVNNAVKNREQRVPDMFIVIALNFARNSNKTLILKDIHAIARQLHKEWLRKHVKFNEKNKRPLLHCVAESYSRI